MSLPDNFFSTVYAWGSPSDKIYGHLVFRSDGSIYGYDNDNERAWEYINEKIVFYDHHGTISSILTAERKNSLLFNGFFYGRRFPVFLIPLITLEQAILPTSLTKPGVFVNTIPKSGSYYVEAALSEAGIKPSRLHLSGADNVDDYRNLTDSEMHRNPESVRLYCRLDLVAAILNNHQAVGHITEQTIINRMHESGVTVLHLIRNLRDVIVSLYKFKLSRVDATGFLDYQWRKFNYADRFMAFLLYHHERDIKHIISIGNSIVNSNSKLIMRFEEITQSKINEEVKNTLDGYSSDMSKKFTLALKIQLNRDNPTYSGQRTDWSEVWNESIEEYFKNSGLFELNKRLGYL